jgi:hypothetical protein
MLLGVVQTWVAEAERAEVVVTVAARRPELAWFELRRAVATS